MQLQLIQQKIFEIRGQNIMLDFDLAVLYEVETRVLNQAVKRNNDRFPEDFMFRITKKEWSLMRSQSVIASEQMNDNKVAVRSQSVIASQVKRNKSVTPYAFTEHGITMLASILKSDKAIKMNIAIVRAFISLKKFAIQYDGLLEQLDELRGRIGGHDAQLNQIYEALENMLDKKVEEEIKQQEWKERKRIGFKN